MSTARNWLNTTVPTSNKVGKEQFLDSHISPAFQTLLDPWGSMLYHGRKDAAAHSRQASTSLQTLMSLGWGELGEKMAKKAKGRKKQQKEGKRQKGKKGPYLLVSLSKVEINSNYASEKTARSPLTTGTNKIYHNNVGNQNFSALRGEKSSKL